jgi:membrane-associated phospholipid phosphatase
MTSISKGREDRENRSGSRDEQWSVPPVGAFFWCLAVIAFITLAIFAHTHRQPLPYELAITKKLQSSITARWIGSFFRFLTDINEPRPDLLTMLGMLILFALFRWFRQGIFLLLAVSISNAVDGTTGAIVGRPRPDPKLVRVDSHVAFNSFPSGHSCYVLVFYGFLIFLTLTRPVRAWRFYWLAIVLQVWAMLNILLVGLARLWEGEHWFLDVLGGYLDGAIWLSLFIFLYQLTTRRLQKRKTIEDKAT